MAGEHPQKYFNVITYLQKYQQLFSLLRFCADLSLQNFFARSKALLLSPTASSKRVTS